MNTGTAINSSEVSPAPRVFFDMLGQSVFSSICDAVQEKDMQLKFQSAPGERIVCDETVPASTVLKMDLTMV